ncbi:MAG: DUF58 domain-containing protein [Actinomycetota bacterium]|nr:DUF58 domain-containing protein [Acidimicrobiia bacterium]MDQ3469097.1 DUF58 domain-containing protein [Actinomycetota bacterium]
MASLLVSVRTKMSLHVRHRVRGWLGGEYPSVHKGRSMDFDDLREYIRGDDVKDVDWKASARSGTILLKRYVAIRKHNVLLVVDTGRSMAARAAGGDQKRDVAIMAAGVLGQIAIQHGDLVGLLAGDAGGLVRAPLRQTNAHLELVLRQIDARIDAAGAPSDLAGLLEAVRRSTSRRMILLVVTDDAPLTDEHRSILRRLRVQHEILWLTINDTVLTEPSLAAADLLDVLGGGRLPAFLRDDPELCAAYEHATSAATLDRATVLRQLGIVADDVGAEADVIPAVLRLLEGTRRAA